MKRFLLIFCVACLLCICRAQAETAWVTQDLRVRHGTQVSCLFTADQTAEVYLTTPQGQAYLKRELKLEDEMIEQLTWLGISGIANVLCCIKMAKYYELTEKDVVGTVLTDSAIMYRSRIEELNQMHGAYNEQEARLDHCLHMLNLKTDNMEELTYAARKRIHNLKYYTWVEQQGETVEDLNALWYDKEGTWDAVHHQAKELDELINAFNEESGVLGML